MLPPQPSLQPHRAQAPTSLTSRLGFVSWLLDFPALSVLPFFRHSIGYRVLSPGHYLGIWFVIFFGPTLFSIFLQIVSGGIANATFGVLTLRRIELPAWWLMEIFAFAMLVSAFVKRRSAWLAFCNGRGTHTNSLGVSYLASLFSIRPDRINRIVDPMVCGIIGLVVVRTSGNALGVWLMVSALALYLFEQRYLEWLLALQFDRHDAALLPELQTRLMSDIKASQQKPPSPVFARVQALAASVRLPMLGHWQPSAELPLPPPTAPAATADSGKQGSRPKWLPWAAWGLGIPYVIVAVYAALQFNYDTMRTQGILYWIMPGVVEATGKGALWPYFWWQEAHDRRLLQEHLAVSLSNDEWATVAANMPVGRQPFTANNINAINTALAHYTARTGRAPKDSDLNEQLRLSRTVMEWRAEAAVSIGKTWNTSSPFRTPRFAELTAQLDTYMQVHKDTARYIDVFGASGNSDRFITERDTYDKAIAAAAKHTATLETANWIIPLGSYGAAEPQYRQNLVDYDKAIAQLAGK
jgi:hypothetical protein